jgi:histone deacetylase complex subunit SAP18
LEEIAQLIEQVIPEARDPDARIAFRLIYLDTERARYACRDIGRVVPANPTEDQKKTLDECKFFIGDYLDVAIFIGPPPIGLQRNNRDRRDFGSNRNRPAGDRFGGRLGNAGGGDRRNNAPYNRDRYNTGGDRFGGGNDRFGGSRPPRRGDRF